MAKRVIISGAGLVGSLLGVTLKKRGFDVEIFERRPDMRKEDLAAGRSINLILTAKGIRALKDVDLDQEIIKKTVPVTGRMMHSLSGELTYQPYGKDSSECNYSVSRAMLNKDMMTIAEREGVKIHFDSALENIDFDSKTAIFSNKKVNYDLLFGADGAGSPTRKALVAKTGGSERTEILGADYKEMYMPAGSNGEYVIEKNALHIWPRGSHMLMALPNLDGSFTMTVYLPTEDFKKLNTKEAIQKHFEEFYKDSIPLMPDYQTEFLENPQGFLGTVRCDTWTYKDSVCLLGDAAHAIVPFFGQGMNSGFDDIAYLSRMMDQHSNDWEKVFRSYEEHQKPAGNAIADMAIENYDEMKSKVGKEKFLIKKKIEHWLENTFPNKYRSRYALVVYSLTPYHLCQAIGPILDEVLESLIDKFPAGDNIDPKLAESLIDEKVTPFLIQNKINLSSF